MTKPVDHENKNLNFLLKKAKKTVFSYKLYWFLKRKKGWEKGLCYHCVIDLNF